MDTYIIAIMYGSMAQQIYSHNDSEFLTEGALTLRKLAPHNASAVLEVLREQSYDSNVRTPSRR